MVVAPVNPREFKDVGRLLSVLSGLVDDPEAYEAKLQALNDKISELNAMVLVVGRVDEIEGIRSHTIQLNESAQALHDEAAEKSDLARNEVASLRTQARDDANATRAKAQSEFSEREMTLAAGEADLAKGESELAKDREAFDTVIASTNKKLLEAKATQQRYLSATQQLREAVGRIAGTL